MAAVGACPVPYQYHHPADEDDALSVMSSSYFSHTSSNTSSSSASTSFSAAAAGSAAAQDARSAAEASLPTERVAFRTRTEVEVLDDGYKWRKYGKKLVKNSPNPRNYYRCSTEGCNVKKRVERDKDDPAGLRGDHVPRDAQPREPHHRLLRQPGRRLRPLLRRRHAPAAAAAGLPQLA